MDGRQHSEEEFPKIAKNEWAETCLRSKRNC